jgi:hypothetical protein
VLRGVAVIPNEDTSSSDDVFLVDSADDSANQASAAVIDDSQMTGHSCSVAVSTDKVMITDLSTGRVLLQDGRFSDLNEPFYGIPGIALPKNGSQGSSNTITTTGAEPHRYLFVADTGADRIKIVSAASTTSRPRVLPTRSFRSTGPTGGSSSAMASTGPSRPRTRISAAIT